MSNAKNKNEFSCLFCRRALPAPARLVSHYLSRFAYRVLFILLPFFPYEKLTLLRLVFLGVSFGALAYIRICVSSWQFTKDEQTEEVKKKRNEIVEMRKRSEWQRQAFHSGYKYDCISHFCETKQVNERTNTKKWRLKPVEPFVFISLLHSSSSSFIRHFPLSVRNFPASKFTSSVWNGNTELSRKMIRPTACTHHFDGTLVDNTSHRIALPVPVVKMLQPFHRFTRQFRLKVYARNNIRIMSQIYFHFLAQRSTLVAAIRRHARTRAVHYTVALPAAARQCRLSTQSHDIPCSLLLYVYTAWVTFVKWA